MNIEIAIEGPLAGIERLHHEIKGLVPSSPPEWRAVARDSSRAALLLHVFGPLLDSILVAVADAVEREERAHPETFEIHVRDRMLSEPPSGSMEFCQPFAPAPGLTIVPWQPSASPILSERILLLDPCHAFGTGKHPTTRLCLRLLLELSAAREGAGTSNGRVIDLGCGSGVLAIAAVKLGLAQQALGIDIDPQAITAARRNITFNGLEQQVVIRQESWDRLEGEVELVVANLTASVLLQAGRLFRSLLTPGGWAIASGFRAEQEKEMAKFFSSCQLRVRRSVAEDKWAAFLLQRESPG